MNCAQDLESNHGLVPIEEQGNNQIEIKICRKIGIVESLTY